MSHADPPTPAPPSAAPARGVLPAVLWACFLATSWTWVIGMLFPVLLVRDFGVAGWAVFAIPNVVGAAAMGFVIARPDVSRQVVANHAQACFRFSELAITMHVFAIGWAYYALFDAWGIIAAGVFAVIVFAAGERQRLVLLVTAVTVLVSVVTLVWWLATPELPNRVAGAARGSLTVTDLAMFAPAAVLGFVLSPYLDLTFHRARQATEPGTGRIAFALGFGVFFLVSLVLALLYASSLRPLFEDPVELALPPALIYTLAAHMTLQAGVTIALHLREIGERRGHEGLHRAGVLAIGGAALAWWAVTEPELYVGLSAGELVYRTFLLVFGLVFPAYVWLCMLPTRHATAHGSRLGVYALTLLFTVPMGYYGFVVSDTGWLLAALAILILARLIVEWLPADTTAAPTRP
ncbi:MAG: hypothetical protein WD009_10855 [Phycisphaeraceae bacterium]